jgi:hypothetical protein
MSDNKTNAATGKGPVTNCIRCDSWVAGTGPTLCENCKAEGYQICGNCHRRVTNGTTPYCDQCAEEIVGAG